MRRLNAELAEHAEKSLGISSRRPPRSRCAVHQARAVASRGRRAQDGVREKTLGAVMAATHRYETVTTWAGNLGTGTSGYRAYSRDHHISTPVKSAPILASSDPAF